MTILFEKDWTDEQGRPRAMVHLKTRNKSFLKLALIYAKMGVKNNLFMLSLYDPKLYDVDPHKLTPLNDPTGEMRLRVAYECKRNAWYYFRECLRVPAAGGDYVRFEASRGNIPMLWCALNSVDYTGTQPRQTGKTIGAISVTSWIMYISGWNMSMSMLTHSSRLVQENVKRLKGMRDGLPSYLVNESKADTDNKEGLSYSSLGNTYTTFIGRTDKTAANNVGRGSTSPFIHVDEIGFIPNIRITFPALMATTNTARVLAARSGMLHGNLYTTTAADPSTDSGAFAFKLVDEAMPFTEKLFDCVDLKETQDMIARNSKNKYVNGTFSYIQLGKTHEWFKDTIARNGVPPDEVERDYLNHWITAAKNPILSDDVRARLRGSKCEPSHVEIFDGFAISWYVPKDMAQSAKFRNKALIMGMDSSDNIGKDFTTFIAIDPKTLSVVFTFRCNDSNTTKIGLLAAQLLLEFPRMLFVPERKSTGSSIIDIVILILRRKGQNPFTRIFNKIVDRNSDTQMKQYNLYDPELAHTAARKFIGFNTQKSSREILYKHTLQRAASLSADRVYCITLIDELNALQVINGRIDHSAGRHDDSVIAWLLACYVVFSGNNLHLYGFEDGDIMSSVEASMDERKIDPAYMRIQLAIRAKINDLKRQRDFATVPAVKVHFSHRIDQLKQYLDESMALEPVSADSMGRDLDRYGSVFGDDVDVDSDPLTADDFKALIEST